MQLTGEHTIAAPRERVWKSINDMALVRRCIPGCESIEPIGDGRYEAAVVAAFGPVKARFRGNMALRELDPPQSYVLEFEGSGGVAGFARGQAKVWLDAIDAGQTRLRHETRADIGGKLAQVGSRLVDAAAAKLSAQFFDALSRELTQDTSPAAAPTAHAAPSAHATPGAAIAGTDQAPSHGWPDRVRVEVALLGGGWLALALAVGALAGLLIGTSIGR